MKGVYQDIILTCDGRCEFASPWKGNRIVTEGDRLLAALMKGKDSSQEKPPLQGIMYLAIGVGENNWTSQTPEPSLQTKKLFKEIQRFALEPEQISYLDDQGQASNTPSHRLEIAVEIKGKDLNIEGFLPLREFGLYGGDAGSEANSGYLIDYVIHPRIDLTEKVTLQRRIRLDFASAAGKTETPFPYHWVGGLPLENIVGVGDVYRKIFAAAGIETIAQLSRFAPEKTKIDIPLIKLIELRSKARLLLTTLGSISFAAEIAKQPALTLLKTPAAKLAANDGATPPQIKQLQDQLGILQLTLDPSLLEQMTLQELTNPQQMDE